LSVVSKRRAGVVIFGGAATVLLIVIHTLPPTGLFSADSGPKYWQSVAFAEGNGLPRVFDYPGRMIDPERRQIPAFTAPVAGGLASIYPVLFPMVSAIPLKVAGDRGIRWIPWFAGVLAAWWVGKSASRIRGQDVTGWIAAAALAATPLAFYSVAFWEQSMAALAIIGGFLLVLGPDRSQFRSAASWAAFGFVLGLGSWIRTEVVFLAPVLAVPVVLDGLRPGMGRTAVASIGCAAGLLTGGVVQFVTVGRWLPLHVTYHVDSSFRAQPFVASRLEAALNFIAPNWSCGLATVIWLIAVAVVLTRRGGRGRFGLALGAAAVISSAWAAFAAPALRWVEGARPTEAFPFAAPAATWIMLSALPIVLWGHDPDVPRDRRRTLLVLAAVWLPIAVFLSRAIASYEWGGRLFVPSALLLLIVMGSFRNGDRRWLGLRRGLVTSAVLAGLVIQSMGLVLLRHGVVTHHRIIQEVLRFSDPGEPVISDAYLVPLLAERGWFSRRFLYCTSQAGLAGVVARLSRHGVDRWTYATVLEAPGERMALGETVVGSDGLQWLLVDRLQRSIGSRTIVLQRYRGN
jgi:hypothetical protein